MIVILQFSAGTILFLLLLYLYVRKSTAEKNKMDLDGIIY